MAFETFRLEGDGEVGVGVGGRSVREKKEGKFFENQLANVAKCYERKDDN